MYRKLIAGFLSLWIVFSACVGVNLATPTSAWAADKPDKANETTATGPRRHLTTIVFAGLAGAILGLSTLSFYGRPQDRLSNIAAGFAIGVISGTVYTTYKAASEPKEFYSLHDDESELWAYHKARARDSSVFIPRASLIFEF
jgi:hypothetical protein